MWEAGLFILIVVAIAVGWVLGRYDRKLRGRNLWRMSTGKSGAASVVDHAGFYRGLEFMFNESLFKDGLLNDKPDEAVEAFIQSLDINRETLELHLALGNLLRRKGEVDRAIRVHQNLLATPVSTGKPQHIQLELARDFIAAGLLDRAEQALLDLVPVAGDLRARCVSLLIEIYQSEKEWQKAVDAAEWIVAPAAKRHPHSVADEIHVSVAHFHCELVELALQQKHFAEAREHVRVALRADRRCVRASLLQGRLLLTQARPRAAIRALRKVEFQQVDMLPETIPLLADAFASVNDRPAFLQLLQRWVGKYPRNSLVLALTAELEKEQGDQAAAKLLAEQLKSKPSLRGLNQLIEYHLQHADGHTQENLGLPLGLLKALIGTLINSKPVYQCDHCGFAGQQLHWHCPGCKKWGHIRPIVGLEGE